MKACTKCSETKPLSDFPRKSSRKDGRGSACLVCHRGYTRRHYQENRQIYLDKSRDHTNKMRSMIKTLKHLKPCMDCGVAYPSYVMDYDHRDPTDKVDSIGRLLHKSKATILQEIAKCDLVCSNCHRERTRGYSSTG